MQGGGKGVGRCGGRSKRRGLGKESQGAGGVGRSNSRKIADGRPTVQAEGPEEERRRNEGAKLKGEKSKAGDE